MILLSTQEFNVPNKENLNRRVNYLKRVLDEAASPTSDMVLISKENFEFPLFSYAFTSYAMTNLAFLNEEYIVRAEYVIKKSIEKVLEYNVYRTYGVDSVFYTLDSLPEYSVLYLGHLNLMLGCYRLISEDTLYNNLNDRISRSLFQRYQNSSYFNLESYPHLIWIPDNTVAYIANTLHDSGQVYVLRLAQNQIPN